MDSCSRGQPIGLADAARVRWTSFAGPMA